MKVGVVFPQTEIGHDEAAVREFGQAAETMGFASLMAYDHVLGAGTRTRPGWNGAYDIDSSFHEVFTLFSYVAALTSSIELVTGVLVLPQRQTALVAKQAAAIDILSRGRLRLGVGIGWNAVEYEALNEDFHNRARRIEEQIEVLRALWTQREVTFEGRWHHIDHAGLWPMPVQQPIPIWIGGTADAAIKRAARLADGFLPNGQLNPRHKDQIALLRQELVANGRDPDHFPIEARITLAGNDPGIWRAQVQGWQELGATSLALNVMGCGCADVGDHLRLAQRGLTAVTR